MKTTIRLKTPFIVAHNLKSCECIKRFKIFLRTIIEI